MSERSAQRKPLTGVRGWLAKHVTCFQRFTSYHPDLSGNTTDCLYIPDELSAAETWSRATREVIALVLLAIAVMAGMMAWAWNVRTLIAAVSLVGGCWYLVTVYFRLYLTLVAVLHPEARTAPAEYGDVADEDLPIYSILVPLYNEQRAILGLVRALRNLDWPSEKLDVRFVMDEGDEVTLDALRACVLPGNFRAVIVKRDSYLRSKPRVLNAALRSAQGEFVTIYDAEDRPERDQLKKAHAMFRKHPEVVCLQARLDYYNEKQNILTRWFTAEYAAWFSYTIAGVSALKLPVPLGGTSNHFRVSVLREVGAWDPYNMTEDCDLGMRLFRLEGSDAVRVLDSVTYEEASSDLSNWLPQRARWIKGYFQTFLVHSRYPLQMVSDFGLRGTFAFIFFTFGCSVVHLVNIGFWSLFILWLCGRNDIVAPFFPPFVCGIHLFTFIAGNIALIALHVLVPLRKRRYGTALAAVFTPLYWVLMALASCKAFYQIVVKPHHWDKTHHEGDRLSEDP